MVWKKNLTQSHPFSEKAHSLVPTCPLRAQREIACDGCGGDQLLLKMKEPAEKEL